MVVSARSEPVQVKSPCLSSCCQSDAPAVKTLKFRNLGNRERSAIAGSTCSREFRLNRSCFRAFSEVEKVGPRRLGCVITFGWVVCRVASCARHCSLVQSGAGVPPSSHVTVPAIAGF